MWRHQLRLLSVLIFAAAVGCGTAAPPAAAPSAAVPASTVGGTIAPVSAAEAEAFSERFLEAITTGDSIKMAATFDGNVMADRSLEGVHFPPRTASQARSTVISTISSPTGFLSQVHRNLSDGGTYRLLRVHDVDGQKRALFRMTIGGNGGVNYHDVLLRKDAAGQVKGYDVYVFLTGEMLSETMKRVFLPIAAQENRSFLDKLAGNEQLLVKHIDKLAQMSRLMQDRKPAEALKVYATLPPELRKEKIVLLQRLRASMEAGDDEEYNQALVDYRATYPTDACIDFLSIDYYTNRKEYDKTLEAIASTEKSLGGDPYLQQMRANVYCEMGKFDEAKVECEAAIEAEPDMLDAHWTIVGISLREKQPEATLKWLKRIEENFKVRWNDLTEDENYKSFTESPQHAEWLAFLNERGKGAN